MKRIKFVWCGLLMFITVMTGMVATKADVFAAHHVDEIRHYRDYNYYKGHSWTTKSGAEKIIDKYNLFLINDPEYERYDEIYACMREEEDDYVDFEPYDFYVEGKRILIYSDEETVEKFLSTNTEEGRKQDYAYAKRDFICDLCIVYEYSLKDSNSDEKFAHLNEPIKDGEEWGTVCVQGYLDKQLLKDMLDNYCEGSVVLENIDTGNTYSMVLQVVNDCADSVNVVTGNYRVISAFFAEPYPAKVYDERGSIIYNNDEATGTFHIGALDNVLLNVTFGNPMTKEELGEPKEIIPIAEEHEEIIPVVEELEKNDHKFIKVFWICMFVLVISGICFVFYKIHRGKGVSNKLK